MKPGIFVEKFFFKQRNLMAYHLPDSEPERSLVSIELMSNFDIESIGAEIDARLARYLEIRQGSPSWVFFQFRQNGKLNGYSFLHTPQKEEWNDSLPTMPGEARISSNFVYPEYRGQGVRGELFKAQAAYARKKNLRLWAIVEQSNISSMRAESKIGFIKQKNYLVKILGINIVSVVTRPFTFYVLVSARRARC